MDLDVDVPIGPADALIPVLEPLELEAFLLTVKEAFLPNASTCLKEMTHFAALPMESILQLADRFDDVAFPLLHAGVMATRGLALLLRRHLPTHIRQSTLTDMQLEDERRMKDGVPPTNLGEMLQMAQAKENFLLEFEKE